MVWPLLIVQDVEVILVLGVEVLTLYEGERVGPRYAASVVDESAFVIVVGLHDLAYTPAVLIQRVVSLV